MEFRPESTERTGKPDINPGFRGENVKHLYPDEDPFFISGFKERVKEFNSVPTKKEAVLCRFSTEGTLAGGEG